MSDTIIGYAPSIQDHPQYEDVDVDFEVGDVVEMLGYTGSKRVKEDGEYIGVIKTIGLTDEDEDGNLRHYTLEKEDGEFGGVKHAYFDPTDLEDIPKDSDFIDTYHVVQEIDGFRVKVAWKGKDDKAKWVPRSRIVGTNLHQKAIFEYQKEKKRRYREQVRQRKETDMDVLMEDVVIPHARKVVDEVWPGGSVDVDEIDWFWNPYLTDAAGMAYYGSAVPESMASGRYAIGLAPDYYYQKGIDSLLGIVRHELIHQWQYQHPDGGDGGHGQKFKQWMDDLDTHRHCNIWSKETSFSTAD